MPKMSRNYGKMIPPFAIVNDLYEQAQATRKRSSTAPTLFHSSEVTRTSDGSFLFEYKNHRVARLTPENRLQILAPNRGSYRVNHVYWINKHTAGFIRPVKRDLVGYTPAQGLKWGQAWRCALAAAPHLRSNWVATMQRLGATPEELVVLSDFTDPDNVMKSSRYQTVTKAVQDRAGKTRGFGDSNPFYTEAYPIINEAMECARAALPQVDREHGRLMAFDEVLATVHLSEDVAFELDGDTHIPVGGKSRQEALDELPMLRKLPPQWKNAWARFRRTLRATELMVGQPFKLPDRCSIFQLTLRHSVTLEDFVCEVLDGQPPVRVIENFFLATGSGWQRSEDPKPKIPLTKGLESYVRRNVTAICTIVEESIGK